MRMECARRYTDSVQTINKEWRVCLKTAAIDVRTAPHREVTLIP